MSKNAKRSKIKPAEDSIGLRVVACCIALLCIITACVYVNTQSLLVFLYLWGALTGSYVSYQFRYKKTFWTLWITSAGLVIVLGNFAEELIFQYMQGKIHPLVPFIHVLTGLQSLHTFDLRAKSDINVSALIGLGLFACTAVLGKDLNFAYITLAYISMGAALFYYESVSRTLKAGNLGKASQDPDLPTLLGPTAQRQRTGSAFLPLSLVPMLSILVFFALPRVESVFDMMIENFHRAQAGEPLTLKFVKEPNGLGLLSVSQNAPVNPSDPKTGTRGYSLVPGSEKGGIGLNLGQAGGQTVGGQKGDGKGLSLSGDGGKAQGKGQGKGKSMSAKGKGKAAAGEIGKLPPPPAPPKKNLDEEDKQMIFRNKSFAAHDEDVILRVMSSQDTYLRRMCFDQYDGHKWTTSKGGKSAKCTRGPAGYQELAGVPTLFVLPQMRASEISQEITVEADIGHTIPVTYIAQRIKFPHDPITVDSFGALHSTQPLVKGTTYHVISQMPDYDVEGMRKAAEDAAAQSKAAQDLAADLKLPTDLSPAVVSLAKEKAGGAGNWFAKAERICNFLRGNYKYSLDEPESQQEISYDFLFQKKQGACGPFATSFIVMCRAVGIPARCVGGFAPGDFNSGTGSHDVRNKHGHAWAEVYVPGYDWVPFDATPTGLLPKPAEEDHSLLATLRKNLEALQVKFAPPPPAPKIVEVPGHNLGKQTPGTGEPGAASTAAGTSKGTGASGKGSKGTTDSSSSTASEQTKGGAKAETPQPPPPTAKPSENLDWHFLVLLPIIVPALMLLFQAVMVAINQWRKRVKVLVEKPKLSTLLFLKVADDLKKLKINRLPSDTPEELLSRFSEISDPGTTFHPDLSPLCRRFMELYCADRFGCDDATEIRQSQLKAISDEIHDLIKAAPSKN